MFEKILVPYDMSESSKLALKWAVHIAGTFQSQLTILHVMIHTYGIRPSDVIEDQENLMEKIQDEIDKDVQEYLGSHKQKTFGDFKIDLLWGHPADKILDEINEKHPDLVIMGTHGRTGLKHFLMGSVAEKVARHSPAPVLTTRQSPAWPPRKILLPIDYSEYSEKQLDYATHFCHLGAPCFELLHAVSLPDIVFYAPHISTHTRENIQSNLEENALDHLKELTAKFGSLKAAVHVETGPAADVICQYGKQTSADLIIMPSHGRQGIDHTLFGSVAEKVIRHAPCSVLSFRPPQLECHPE